MKEQKEQKEGNGHEIGNMFENEFAKRIKENKRRRQNSILFSMKILQT